jgi:TPR repeat protein
MSVTIILLATTANADFASGMKAYEAGNFETAIRELSPPAKQGDANAQYQMGLIYNNGDGVPQNYNKAATWFRRAAMQGHVDAQVALGRMYLHGKGVPKDNVLAYVWLNLAVAQGDDELKLGEKGRRMAEINMTPEQLARAQALSQEYYREYSRSQQSESALSTSPTLPGSNSNDGYRIQLGSFQNEKQAFLEWLRLQERYPEVLGSLQFDIQRAEIGRNRTFYRLQAGPLEQSTAAAKCRILSNQHNENCLLVER